MTNNTLYQILRDKPTEGYATLHKDTKFKIVNSNERFKSILMPTDELDKSGDSLLKALMDLKLAKLDYFSENEVTLREYIDVAMKDLSRLKLGSKLQVKCLIPEDLDQSMPPLRSICDLRPYTV